MLYFVLITELKPLLVFHFRVEEIFAGGKFREIPFAVDIYFARGKFRVKYKFANIAKNSYTRKIRVIQYIPPNIFGATINIPCVDLICYYIVDRLQATEGFICLI